MVALAAACAFSACSDDDDDDDSPIITSSSSFKGTSTASVATFTIPMEDDVVTVAPMEKDKKMAQLTFAAREMPIRMGPAAMKMDAFTIDSCIVSGSADNYQLKRENPFSVSGVKVSVSMIPGESEQTVTGTLSSANLADGVLTVKLDNVKAHENMPMTMSISFEGQLSK